jgi:Na+/proline symporter
LYGNANGAVYEDVLVNGKTVKHFILNNANVIGDKASPSIVLNYFPPAVGIMFIIALISALFPSADGALTALTSSFCIDIIGLKRRDDLDEKQKKRLRLIVHLSFTITFLICIMVFRALNDNSIIDKILDLAGYTYGPLLGLFAFGIFTKKHLPNTFMVTLLCLIAPVLSYIFSVNARNWFNGYQIGIELLIINGLITFAGLWAISGARPAEVKA